MHTSRTTRPGRSRASRLREASARQARLRRGSGAAAAKASISHDDATIREIQKDPAFAAEYLKAALEDTEEPRVLLIALPHVALAHGVAKGRH